jgi:hypothetical protein
MTMNVIVWDLETRVGGREPHPWAEQVRARYKGPFQSNAWAYGEPWWMDLAAMGDVVDAPTGTSFVGS